MVSWTTFSIALALFTASNWQLEAKRVEQLRLESKAASTVLHLEVRVRNVTFSNTTCQEVDFR